MSSHASSLASAENQFQSLMNAMASFENVNPDYNNPLGIMYGDYAAGYGATSAPSGLAIFPDLSTGYAAANNSISNYASQGYSLSDLINAWSPSNAAGNSTASTNNYINHVSSILGVTPSSLLSSLMGGSGIGVVASAASFFTGSRFVSIALGLVCIAGGIFMFKPVKETVITTVKTAAKTAAATA